MAKKKLIRFKDKTNTVNKDVAQNLPPDSQPGSSSRRPLPSDGAPSGSMGPPHITPRLTKRARAPASDEENDSEAAHITPRPKKRARVSDGEEETEPNVPQPGGQRAKWVFVDPPQQAPAPPASARKPHRSASTPKTLQRTNSASWETLSAGKKPSSQAEHCNPFPLVHSPLPTQVTDQYMQHFIDYSWARARKAQLEAEEAASEGKDEDAALEADQEDDEDEAAEACARRTPGGAVTGARRPASLVRGLP